MKWLSIAYSNLEANQEEGWCRYSYKLIVLKVLKFTKSELTSFTYNGIASVNYGKHESNVVPVHAMKAYRGSGGIIPFVLNLVTR
jgi:hypothetical protein